MAVGQFTAVAVGQPDMVGQPAAEAESVFVDVMVTAVGQAAIVAEAPPPEAVKTMEGAKTLADSKESSVCETANT